jgi:Polymerase beta, Nucleotidyltransferase
MTQEYIDRLVLAYPSITKIWLFGSRANGLAKPESDWDYLAFGDDASVLHALHNDPQFNATGIDLMFVGPGVDEAIKPWQEADRYWKKLGLGAAPGGIDWQVISDTEARYIVHRDRSPGSFETAPQILQAELIYRRDPKRST